jgi:hypothetical protein
VLKLVIVLQYIQQNVNGIFFISLHCKKIFIERADCWDEEQRAPVGDDGEGPGAQ